MIWGAASDYMISKFGLPRPAWMMLTAIILAVTSLMISEVSQHWILIPACILVGIAFGGIVSILVSISADFFGTKYVSATSKNICFFPFVGSVIFATMTLGTLYDEEANKQQLPGHSCIGSACFQLGLRIFACVNLIACCVSLYLCFRSKNLYTKKTAT